VNVNNRDITFLDTPGHEAFTSLRARGAQVTDIAILVVAADDGVKPQTIEAINHAKAANVQIIVAVNKMDVPGANPEKVKQQLTEYGLLAEEWGGDTVVVEISAKKKQNIDQLLDMILLTSDMLELKANPDRQAKGTVIEAQLDKHKGPIATLLVQRGTLKVGDSIVTGTTVGRIRAMTNDRGQEIEEAGPSTPVEIIGLPEVPIAGELFYAITDERVAKHLAERRKIEAREAQYKTNTKVTLDDLFSQIQKGEVKELNIIIKADTQGSAEALKQSLEKMENNEVKVKIVHMGVGAVTESDVTLADVTNAIIIGFNVRPGANVKEFAESSNVDIRLYRIIYNAIEDIEAAMKGMLSPKYKEVVLGHADVRQIFKISGVGTVAGCYVTDGKILRSSEVRLVRDGIVIHEGKLAALKRFKDDVKEVAQGYECGMSFEKYNDIKEGDVLEAFNMEEVTQ
jgi:translation initiation factor IF-2